MAETLISIKEVNLNNNCPECYNNKGLQLTFKQKYKETEFFKSITNETTQEIECKMCNTIIYPVMWTDDIERVFRYQQKTFVPEKPSIKLKKKGWLLIALFGLIFIAGVVFLVIYK